MKRDILDDALKQKLHDYGESPPPDMWAAIEADRSRIPVAVAAPVVNRSLVLSRNMWRYGVAASLIIIIAVSAVLYESRPKIVVADLIDLVAQSEPDPKAGAEIQEVISDILATDFRIENLIPQGVVVSRRADVVDNDGVEAVKPESTDQEKVKPKLQPAKELTQLPVVDKEKKSSTPSRREDVEKAVQQPKWYDVAQEPTKKRRRLSSAIYADNLNFGSTNVNLSSMSRAAYSKFSVNEINLSSPAIQYRTEYTPESLRHHAPLAFGLSLSMGVSKRLDVETGLTYTYLKSDADTNGDIFLYKMIQQLHYLGVPISIKYNFILDKSWGIYARTGAMIEQCIYARRVTKVKKELELSNDGEGSYRLDTNGIEGSLSAGVGAEYNFTKHVGIYVEPSLTYQMPNSGKLVSYRTENQPHFALKAGFRFNFR